MNPRKIFRLKPLTRIAGAVASLFILYSLFRWAMPHLPEPIGSRSDLFIEGAQRTFKLTLCAATIGLAIALIFSILRTARNPLLRGVSYGYLWIVQGTPLLVQIFFFYFAIPKILPGIRMDDWNAALWALAFNVGAYNTQAIRAGMDAVPKGQLDAAESLSLSRFQTLRLIILPQALRMMIAPLTSNVVALLKDSALASSIGLLELSLAGARITSETFDPVPVLITVAGFYLIMSTVLMLFTGQIPWRALR